VYSEHNIDDHTDESVWNNPGLRPSNENNGHITDVLKEQSLLAWFLRFLFQLLFWKYLISIRLFSNLKFHYGFAHWFLIWQAITVPCVYSTFHTFCTTSLPHFLNPFPCPFAPPHTHWFCYIFVHFRFCCVAFFSYFFCSIFHFLLIQPRPHPIARPLLFFCCDEEGGKGKIVNWVTHSDSLHYDL